MAGLDFSNYADPLDEERKRAATRKPDFSHAADEVAAPTDARVLKSQLPADTPFPEPNIGMKGDMRAGDRVFHDLPQMALQGMTLGGSDELLAGLTTPFQMSEGLPLGEAYQQAKAEQNASLAASRQDHPAISSLMELMGAITTGYGPAKKAFSAAVSAPTTAGKALGVAKGAGTGAVQGGVYGFNTGEGLDDRITEAERGAAIGAGFGTVLPPAMKAGRSVISAVTSPYRAYAAPEKYAAQKVAQALERDNVTIPQAAQRVTDLKNQSTQATLADAGGKNVHDLMRSALNMPNAQRDAFGKALDQRQRGQFYRIKDAFGAAMGSADDFYAKSEQLLRDRKALGDKMFEAARNTPTPYTKDLEAVLNRPLTKRLVVKAADAAANRGEQFNHFFVQHGPDSIQITRVPDTDALHRIKVEIDKAIGVAKRGQDTSMDVRDLTILKKDLVGAIQNPAYKAALKQYAGDSAMVNALEDGFENGLKMPAPEIIKTLHGMSPGEQDLWRLGQARAVVDRLAKGNFTRDRVKTIDSPEFMGRIRASFPNLSDFREFQRALARENAFTRTRAAAQGNSTTAGQIAAGEDAANEADVASGTLQALRGDWLGVAQRLGKRFTGMNPKSAAEVLRILRSPDATAKVAQADLRRELGDRRFQEFVRALTRASIVGVTGATSGQPNLPAVAR